MGKEIIALASYMQSLCVNFLAQAESQGIDCLLVDTDRTPSEQEQKLKDGVSWTEHSRHLPQPPENKSEAFDVCPKVYLGMKGWNPSGDLWDKLGVIGEGLGLGWGGRWTGKKRDPGHFQYVHPQINLDAGDN